MDLLKAFRDFAAGQHLFTSRDRLLLAVSGGMDSVVLCELCGLAGLDFVIAHCNFRLRGAESERDEQFVRALGEKYKKPVVVKSFDTQVYATSHKVSIQVAARDLRYEWFRELLTIDGSADRAGARSARYPPLTRIVTAHHLDDNIETLLMNFFKGTGIAGLRGMLPVQGNIIRPLLFAGKEELRQFATEYGLEWVEDSSNESDKYTRNYFRHQLIPLAERVYPGALHNLAANLDRFRGTEWFYREAIDRYKKKLLEHRGDEIHIPVLKLKKLPGQSKKEPAPEVLRTLVYEIIRDFGFSPQQVDEAIRLLDSETGRYIESATHRILKNRNWLILAPHPCVQGAHIVVESSEGGVRYGNGELHFQRLESLPAADNPGPGVPDLKDLIFLDAAAIRFPLLLRKWKPGDYFYPLGMRKKKKLARFFIDNKLSAIDKEKMWVLEMDKKIIWVIGQRIDERFKITPSTKEVLKIVRGPHK